MAVPTFPDPSIADHVTVVVPTGNVAGALFVTEVTVQLSIATGVPKAIPVTEHPDVITEVTLAGAVIVGSALSTTVTICEAIEVLPTASVAVHVTIVEPIG